MKYISGWRKMFVIEKWPWLFGLNVCMLCQRSKKKIKYDFWFSILAVKYLYCFEYSRIVIGDHKSKTSTGFFFLYLGNVFYRFSYIVLIRCDKQIFTWIFKRHKMMLTFYLQRSLHIISDENDKTLSIPL